MAQKAEEERKRMEEEERKKVEVLLLYSLQRWKHITGNWLWFVSCSGPSCSKLTMSLVNDSLKFTSSDTQIC